MIRGGFQSTDQSRLFSFDHTRYMTTPSTATGTGQRPIPQSYPSSQPLIQTFSPPQPQSSTSLSGASIQMSYLSASFTSSARWSSTSVSIPLPQSQRGTSSLQRIPLAQDVLGRQSPSQVFYAQPVILQQLTTTNPRTRGLQPSIPSMTSRSLDATTATQDRLVGPPRRPPASPSRSTSSSTRTSGPPSPSTRSARSRNVPDESKPSPQNLRGDPFRTAKIKTELCRHFNTRKGCEYGANCNYAHGEHELINRKLMELDADGLVDAEVYRCYACPTWVATGAW